MGVLGGDEVGAVFRGEEGGLVVVKPPGDAGGIFEVNDCVLGGGVGGRVEFGVVKESSGAVDEAVVLICDTCGVAAAFGRVI